TATCLRCSATSMRGERWPLLCGALLIAAGDANAFTFVDGTSMRCLVAGSSVAEVPAPPSHPIVTRGRIAVTQKVGPGYRIVWNEAQLKALPAERAHAVDTRAYSSGESTFAWRSSSRRCRACMNCAR